jgi:hypothetical protein
MPERPAKPDILRGIFSRIRTGIKIVEAALVCVGHGIVVREKYKVGIG